MGFIYYNNNPKGYEAKEDSIIRAIALILEIDYKEAYKRLFEIACKKCRMINEKHVYRQLLRDERWITEKMPQNEDGTRQTVSQFCEGIGKQGRYVLQLANKSLVVCIDGNIYDIYDSRYKAHNNKEEQYVYNYFRKLEPGDHPRNYYIR